MGGSKGDESLRRAMLSYTAFYRYWECESMRRRDEVIAALSDAHYYEYGHDEVEDAACIRVRETY